MPKYIDLLRQHQNKTAEPSSPAATATETVGKPDLKEQYAELERMIAEDEDPTVSTDDFSRSSLLTDEESSLLADEKAKPSDQTLSEPASELLTPSRPLPSGDSDIGSDWLHRFTQEIGQLFQAASNDTPADIQPLTAQLSDFFKKMPDNPKLVDNLELAILQSGKEAGEFEDELRDLIQKSIMMMLYALKVGRNLKLNTDELRSHTLAAILHHIGMSQIATETRKKKGPLTESELNKIKGASKMSYDYLSRCGITDAAILQAARQAQERFDGSGPQGLSGKDVAHSARMVGLLSMFEALIHYRPHRPRLLPRDAIRQLLNHHKTAFDPVMLKALIESISLYPVGTYVQLNSGDIGLVVKVHVHHPLRPVTQVMFNSHGDAIANRMVDLKYHSNLTVQRCMYEEDLQELKDDAGQGSR